MSYDIQPPKISDQIEVLAGSRLQEFLCLALRDRGHTEAATMVGDWVRCLSNGNYGTLVNVWAEWAGQDGVWVPGFACSQYLEARDKWCLDYAEFLREFGL